MDTTSVIQNATSTEFDTVFVTIFVTIIATLISTLAATALIAFINLRQVKKDKQELFKVELHKKRVEAYQKFWALLGPTSQYYFSQDNIIERNGERIILNIINARDFFVKLRDFYYSEHGLFISSELRTAIFRSRNTVEKIIANRSKEKIENFRLSANELKAIRNLLSDIHFNARKDLGISNMDFKKEALDISDN